MPSYEELEVGRTARSRGRTITEADNVGFSALTHTVRTCGINQRGETVIDFKRSFLLGL